MKKFFTIAAAMIMMVMTGCKENDEHLQKPVIKVVEPTELPAAAGEYKIQYSIENPVDGEIIQAMTSSEWISEILAGSQEITVKYDANQNTESRTAEVILKYKGADDKSVTLSQKGKQENQEPPVIKVNDNLELAAEGGEYNLEYTVENPVDGTDIKVTSESSWLSFSDITNSSAVMKYQANPGKNERTASVKFEYDGAESVEITVRQSGKTVTEPEFTFETVELTFERATIKVIPADSEMTYFSVFGEKKEESDEDFIQSVVDNIIENGTWYGQTAEEAIESSLRKGPAEMSQSMLTPETTYYIYAFGYTVDGTATTEVYEFEYTTPKPELADVKFDFAVLPTIDYTLVCADPENKMYNYYFDVLPKAEYEAYGEDIASKIIQEINEKIETEGGYFREYMQTAIAYFQEDLTPGETYVAFAFEAEKGYQLSEVKSIEFTAGEVATEKVSFLISEISSTTEDFRVEITPSDENIKWFAFLYDSYWLERYGLSGIADRKYYEAYGTDGSEFEKFLRTGECTISSKDLGEEYPDSSITYLIGVFGVNDKGERVTDIFSKNIQLN